MEEQILKKEEEIQAIPTNTETAKKDEKGEEGENEKKEKKDEKEKKEKNEENEENVSHKVLILDIDQTLLDCAEFCRLHEFDPAHVHHEVACEGSLLYEHHRPFLPQFFAWCQEQDYKIIFWSAVEETFLRKRVGLLQEQFSLEILGMLGIRDMARGGTEKRIETVCGKFNLKPKQILAIDDCRGNYCQDRGKCLYIAPWYGRNPHDNELMAIGKTITAYFAQEERNLFSLLKQVEINGDPWQQEEYIRPRDPEESYVSSMFNFPMYKQETRAAARRIVEDQKEIDELNKTIAELEAENNRLDEENKRLAIEFEEENKWLRGNLGKQDTQLENEFEELLKREDNKIKNKAKQWELEKEEEKDEKEKERDEKEEREINRTFDLWKQQCLREETKKEKEDILGAKEGEQEEVMFPALKLSRKLALKATERLIDELFEKFGKMKS